MKYRIWSIEHDAWWGPNECGYVKEKELAGEYHRKTAEEICARANRHPRCENTPHEAMVPIED